MDIHEKVEGLTADTVAQAHACDLEVQGRHGVDFKKYWFDEETGTAFCLVDAPDVESATRVRRESHGRVSEHVIPVRAGDDLDHGPDGVVEGWPRLPWWAA
jgi:hypothetical protein